MHTDSIIQSDDDDLAFNKIILAWGRLLGRVVKFAHSAVLAQGSDPGRGHGTACQAMLRWRPTSHNWKDLQLRYTTTYGGVGEIKQKKKKDWQQLLAQEPIL